PLSPPVMTPGVWLNVCQMLGPAPSASGDPSIWYEAVAEPHTKPRGKRRTGTRTLLDLIDDGFALPFVFVLRDQAHLVEPLKDLELFLDVALLVGEGGIRRGRGIAALRSLRRRSSLLL